MSTFKLTALLSIVVVLLTFSLDALAQNIPITGTVNDPNGVPLAGVTVSIRGSNTATQTNSQGGFSLSAPGNATLVFSYIGFETMEVPVQGRNTVDVTLAGSNAALNEVVVIGYGTARRRDVTG